MDTTQYSKRCWHTAICLPVKLIAFHVVCDFNQMSVIIGVSQSSTQATGPLGTIQTVGNLKRIRLNALNQTGSWEIHMNSVNAYTVKVTGGFQFFTLMLCRENGRKHKPQIYTCFYT